MISHVFQMRWILKGAFMDQGSPTNENRIENKIKMWVNACRTAPFFFPSSWKCLHASGSCSFPSGTTKMADPPKDEKEKLPPFLLLLIVHKVLSLWWTTLEKFSFFQERNERKRRNWFSEEAEIFLRFHLTRLKNCVVLRDKKKRKQHWRDLAVEKNHKRLVILPSGLHLLQHNQRFFFHYVSLYLI